MTVFLSDFNKIACIFAYKILLQKQIYSFSVENINGVHELF